MARSPVRRTRSGDFKVDLDDSTRALLRHMCDEMEHLLDSDSPLLTRLFPPPYGDDEERNAGFAALAVPELIENRRASLAVVRDSAGATRLDEDRLMAWMRSVNDIRLVLGTLLGIEEDGVQPVVPDDLVDTWAVYEFLGALLDVIVAALD